MVVREFRLRPGLSVEARDAPCCCRFIFIILVDQVAEEVETKYEENEHMGLINAMCTHGSHLFTGGLDTNVKVNTISYVFSTHQLLLRCGKATRGIAWVHLRGTLTESRGW